MIEIALTFDDGPSECTDRLLRILNEYGVKATFFIIGERVDAHRNVVVQALKTGHQLGNHTYTHEFSRDGVLMTDDIIRNLYSEAGMDEPKEIPFRLPCGESIRLYRDDPRIPVLREIQRDYVEWDIDIADWEPSRQKPDVLERQLRRHLMRLQDGMKRVVDLHDGDGRRERNASREPTVEAVLGVLKTRRSDWHFTLDLSCATMSPRE